MGALALTLATLAAWAAGAAHPLHTTWTELSYGPDGRTIEVSVRVFVDDLRAALGREVTDASAFAYLASAVAVTDRAGRPLALAWCGMRRTGDVVWLCLRAPAPAGVSGLAGFGVEVRVLFEVYRDQINIVQASSEGRRTSLLFSRGDRPKRVP